MLSLNAQASRPVSARVGAMLAALVATAPAIGGPVTFTTIVLTGQPAPGFPAATIFSAVADPRLDEQGHWMFWARLSGGPIVLGNDTTFWSNRTGGFAMVIREGMAAPGSADLILSLSTPEFSDSGYFAFMGALGTGATTQPTNLAILAEDSAGVGIFARENPSLLTLGLPAFNDAGALVFRNGAGSGIWTTRSGAAVSIASTGAPAPETTFPNATFLLLGIPAHNVSSQAVFRASISYTGQTVPAYGIWAETAQSLHAIAVTGTSVPGLDPAVAFTDFDSLPQLSGPGMPVFWASFAGGPVTPADDSAIFAKSGGTLSMLVREGQPAPGLPGLVLASLSRTVSVSDSGVVAFTATLAGPGITTQNNTALYTIDASSVPAGQARLIARENDDVFGLSAGVQLAALERPALSGNGRVVFGAYLRGPNVTQNSSYALFAADGTGMLHTIARVGDTIPLPPPASGERTIAQIVIDHGATQTGLRAYSAAGLLAYKLVFTDNSAGLFAANIPACPADYNGDGFADGIDFDLFVNAFESGAPEADFNNDGFVDGIDFDQFMNAFERGC